MSLQEYVFSLKDMVGLNNLIEVIGIGKGKKHDLTCTGFHHPRIISPMLQKSYSELSSAEIMNFMRGGARLSKAKSIDLFWEAVWPRLLANGWHSEESRKDSVVFVIPGVDKFSRQGGLVKGRHYFDSVTDVLSRVASEPELLHIESSEVISDRSEYSGAERTSDQEVDEIMSCGVAGKSREERYLAFSMAETDIFKPVKNNSYSQVKFNPDESQLPNSMHKDCSGEQQSNCGVAVVAAASASSDDVIIYETQLGTDCPRQSGRKRRMTTRALESLALSYMGMHTKKRN